MEEAALIVDAQNQWIKNYGRTRKRLKTRIDHNIFGRKAATGEKAFVHMHRAALSDLLGDAGKLLPRRHDLLDAADFTDKQVREWDFNTKKAHTTLVESFLSGHLLPDEITPELLLAAHAHLEKIKKKTEGSRGRELET